MNNNNKDILLKKLRLYRTENIGPVTYRMIIGKYKLEDAIEAVKEISLRGGKRNINIPSVEKMQEELHNHHKIGAEIIDEGHEDFPKVSLKDFPPILSVLGNKKLLEKMIIAVIGTRLPSLQGMQYTKHICEFMASHSYIIASGFAKGIDTVAHESSLTTGTIALLPCGIDVIFPQVNMLLYAQIKKHGLLISDRPFGQQPMQRNFPQRNKLLAQLVKGVIVTEATIQSGSLMTASIAQKMKKLVFSVPGHPLDTRYGGNNLIIANGGILIQSPNTIFEHLSRFHEEQNLMEENPPIDTNINENMREKILSLLSFVPMNVEDICIHTAYTLGEVNYVLLELELAGRLERLFNNQVCLIKQLLN
jgi:DNA processing protein